MPELLFFSPGVLFCIALESKIEVDILGQQTVALTLAVNVKLQDVTAHCATCILDSSVF